MAENLNYQSGTSWCYDNDCKRYGRLYNWETARSVCPGGWHLPSLGEWNELVNTAGGSSAGAALKSRSGWNYDKNGTDKFGFSALPGGYRDGNTVNFNRAGELSYWWTASESGGKAAYYRGVYDYKDDVIEAAIVVKAGFGFSVRCLQN